MGLTKGTLNWYRETLMIDAHNDVISRMRDSGLDFCLRQSATHSDLPRLLEAGVNLQVLALFAPPDSNKSVTLQRILSYAEYALDCIDRDQRLHLVRTKADLEMAAPGKEKLGVILGVEGGDCLGEELWILRLLFRLGVRLLTITWSNRNALADGIWEENTKGGLTVFGKEVIKEMEALGMVIDVSHLAPAGFWDVAEVASGPFIASHSNAAAICSHPRNLTDEQIRCIADRGGVVGVNFCGPHLTEAGSAALDDVIVHIEHLWNVAGEDHVGLGTDYDGIDVPPKGLEDVTALPRLIENLQRRGHSESRLEKFMGGNFLRFFNTVLPD
jgi:membrane dipeptidase